MHHASSAKALSRLMRLQVASGERKGLVSRLVPAWRTVPEWRDLAVSHKLGCLPAAWRLFCDKSVDPLHKRLLQHVSGLFDTVSSFPSSWVTRLRQSWRLACNRLSTKQRHWHEGPCLVSSVNSRTFIGQLRTSTRTDRRGRSHCLDFSCGLLQSQLAFEFIESQEEALWQKASRRPGGQGLEQGADLPVARRQLGRSPSNVQALRALVQGSIPSADNSLRDSCPFCQDPHPNLIHMLWQCRELDTVNGQVPLNGYVKLLSRNRHTSD